MKKILLIAAVSAAALSACSKNTPPEEKAAAESSLPAPSATAPAAPADNAETSLDWTGEYKGVFPCADCSGIETELELKADKTYELTEEYLGKGSNNEFKTTGTFSFDANNSSIITLDSKADSRKFFIGENFAEARDRETGNALDTKLNYKLMKQSQN